MTPTSLVVFHLRVTRLCYFRFRGLALDEDLFDEDFCLARLVLEEAWEFVREDALDLALEFREELTKLTLDIRDALEDALEDARDLADLADLAL